MSIIKNMFGVTTSSEDADYAQIKPEGAQKDIKLPDYLDGSKYNPEKGFFQEYLLFDNLSATGRKWDTDDFEEYQDIARVGTKILQAPARIVTDVVQDALEYSEDSEKAQGRSEAIDKAYRDASSFVSEEYFGLPASAVVDDKGTPRRTTTGKGLTLDMASMVYTGLRIYRGTEDLSLVRNPNKTMKKVNKALRALAAGQLTAQLLMDSEENNAQIISDLGLKNTRIGPVLEYLSADENDPRLLKRAKLATTELITELTFAGTLRMFGVFGKSAIEFSRKTFGKEIEELNEAEQDEFLTMVLTNTQRANQKRPSPAVQVVREANEDSAEGIKQVLNQQTNNKTWLGKSASMLYKYKQRYFTSRGFLTEQGYSAKQKALWSTRETVGHAEALAKRLESRMINFEAYHGVEGGDIGNMVADALQADLRKIPKNRRARILQQQYNLPPDIAYDVLEARTMIDKLSQEWIDSGIGTEGLRAAMAENLSSYLRRSYRAFDEKGYVPTDKNRQDAIDFIEELHIKERYTAADIEDGLTDEQLAAANRFAELEVDKILKETEGKNYGETVQNLMRINSNLLKGRKEVPREIRRLLGEYESTPINILQTVTKLANMVETNRYFKTLEELGGSTPADKVLYVRANRKARREIESMNVDELQRDFDVTLPQDENVTAGGKAGVFKRINSEGEYIVEFKNSKTGELTEEPFASTDIRLIPRDAVLDKLTKKYYKEEGGVFTESKYIFAQADNPPEGYVKIEGTGSSLDRKYTSPEMKIAIENLEATFAMSSRIRNSKIVQGWRSIKGVTQQMKTVWDHTTQLRNNFGGLNFSARNGLYTLENSKTAMKILANTMSDMPAKQWDFVYNRLRGLGVVNTQAQAGEWQALLTGADDLTPQQWTDRIEKFVLNLDQKVDNTLERIGGTVNDVDPNNPWLSGSVGGEKRINSNPLNLPQKFYMAVDDFYKINGFAEELKVLSKAYPDKPYNELLDEAAEIVRNTFPNYDMIPNGLKALRDLPLGNFVAFTPEIIRTETKILAQTLKELSSSNPVIRQRGMKRLSGGLVVHGGWMAAGTFAASATGITDVQEGALQTLAESPWSKKHNKIFFRVGSDFYYSDPTYLNPYDVFPSVYKTWQAEMMDKDFKGIDTDKWEKNIFDAAAASMLDSVAFATDPALGAKYLFDLGDAFYSQNGYTREGKQIFKNHRDSEGNIISWDNVILGMVDFSMETVAPGFVADATDLRDAMNETPNPRTGFVKDARLKLIEFFTGFNLKKIDIEYLLTMKGRQFSSRLGYRVDKADKPEFFKDNPDVPFANWFNNIAKEQAERFSAEQDFYRQLVAFQDLGVIENDIKDILKENVNISFDTTDDLLDNRFVPRRPSVATMKEAKERFGKDHEGFYYLEKWFQGIENLRLTPTDPSLQLPEQEYTRDQINQLREGRKIDIFNNNFPKVKDIINKRGYYARGGEVEVLNVPNVPVRPDNRLDKLTGRTYLEQARDPLRRLGFVGGGSVNVDPLANLGFGGSRLEQNVQNLKAAGINVNQENPYANQEPTQDIIDRGGKGKTPQFGGSVYSTARENMQRRSQQEGDYQRSLPESEKDLRNTLENLGINMGIAGDFILEPPLEFIQPVFEKIGQAIKWSAKRTPDFIEKPVVEFYKETIEPSVVQPLAEAAGTRTGQAVLGSLSALSVPALFTPSIGIRGKPRKVKDETPRSTTAKVVDEVVSTGVGTAARLFLPMQTITAASNAMMRNLQTNLKDFYKFEPKELPETTPYEKIKKGFWLKVKEGSNILSGGKGSTNEGNNLWKGAVFIKELANTIPYTIANALMPPFNVKMAIDENENIRAIPEPSDIPTGKGAREIKLITTSKDTPEGVTPIPFDMDIIPDYFGSLIAGNQILFQTTGAASKHLLSPDSVFGQVFATHNFKSQDYETGESFVEDIKKGVLAGIPKKNSELDKVNVSRYIDHVLSVGHKNVLPDPLVNLVPNPIRPLVRKDYAYTDKKTGEIKFGITPDSKMNVDVMNLYNPQRVVDSLNTIGGTWNSSGITQMFHVPKQRVRLAAVLNFFDADGNIKKEYISFFSNKGKKYPDGTYQIMENKFNKLPQFRAFDKYQAEIDLNDPKTLENVDGTVSDIFRFGYDSDTKMFNQPSLTMRLLEKQIKESTPEMEKVIYKRIENEETLRLAIVDATNAADKIIQSATVKQLEAVLKNTNYAGKDTRKRSGTVLQKFRYSKALKKARVLRDKIKEATKNNDVNKLTELNKQLKKLTESKKYKDIKKLVRRTGEVETTKGIGKPVTSFKTNPEYPHIIEMTSYHFSTAKDRAGVGNWHSYNTKTGELKTGEFDYHDMWGLDPLDGYSALTLSPLVGKNVFTTRKALTTDDKGIPINYKKIAQLAIKDQQDYNYEFPEPELQDTLVRLANAEKIEEVTTEKERKLKVTTANNNVKILDEKVGFLPLVNTQRLIERGTKFVSPASVIKLMQEMPLDKPYQDIFNYALEQAGASLSSTLKAPTQDFIKYQMVDREDLDNNRTLNSLRNLYNKQVFNRQE